MIEKRVPLLLLSLLLSFLPVTAQEFKDVRETGDIWVVTVDNSGSMLYKTTRTAVAQSVYSRLLSGDCLSSAHFERDRFLFLTSGFTFTTHGRLIGEIRSAGPFDKSFIHATDGKLYSFPDRKACAAHIRDLLKNNDYKHNLSFVSQIRVFSIIHAVNLLKSRGETDSFDALKVLTITDDADQNDQWMMDYRNLKIWDPKKVQEVNDSTSKYVFNNLNGKGKGYLDEVFADEARTPHLWVYSYRSMQQDTPESELDLLTLKASDGRNIRAFPKADAVQGDSICFFHIDSLLVNGKTAVADASFRSGLVENAAFDNGFRTNKTEIRGYAQVVYDDEIFGRHYRVVPFVQKKTVLSQKQGTVLTVLGILAGLFVLGLLTWLLLIRPHLKLFTVYSTLGKKAVVRRGFAGHWRGDYIPFQCYQDGPQGLSGVITRKHRDIRVDRDCPVLPGSEIVLCARRPVSLSVKAISCNTADDLESIFFSRTGEYSPLLREQYEKTPFHKLYRRYLLTRNELLQRCIGMLLRFLNAVDGRYYYLIKDVTAENRIYVSCDSLLPGKRFIIETSRDGAREPVGDRFLETARRALKYYYENETPLYDLILGSFSAEGRTDWVLLSFDDRFTSKDSLRSVTSLIRFSQKASAEGTPATAARIMAALGKEFPRKRIGHVDTTGVEVPVPLSFAVRESTGPGYVSFIESAAQSRSQLLYSPAKDADVEEKFIRLRPRLLDGHLYLSAIPLRYLSADDPLLKKVSQTLVRTEEKQPSVLRLCDGRLEFRDINEKI